MRTITLEKSRKLLSTYSWKLKYLNWRHNRESSNYLNILLGYLRGENSFDFTSFRQRMLLRTLKYAVNNSNYYKKKIGSLDSFDLNLYSKVPLLTKEIIRFERDNIVTTKSPHHFLTETKTGGSTGEPLGFWSSGSSDGLHQKFLYEYYGYKKGDKILAMDGTFIETSLLSQNIFWKTKNNGCALPYGGMALSSLYLTNDNIELYYKYIEKYKPSFIRGYPAFLTDISKYILDNNKTIGFPIKGIELTSEMVFDHQIEIIRQAFRTKVFGQYGHSEACVFGFTIDNSFDYYCSPLYGYTEVINDSGRHVNIGEDGEIVVTGFANYGMPFIRYKTGDRAIYAGEKNGIVKLNKLFGRTADYLINEKGDKILLTALIFGQHYNAMSQISAWQFIQNRKGIVTIKISKLPNYSRKDELEIYNSFKNIGNIECQFCYDDQFIKTNSGKTTLVIQNII